MPLSCATHTPDDEPPWLNVSMAEIRYARESVYVTANGESMGANQPHKT